MVAPLGPIRPTTGVQPSGPTGQPAPTDADFGAELDKALQSLASQSPANPAASLLGDDLAASLQLANQSLQRASAHINAARGYFRGATPTTPDADTPSVDRPA